MTTRSRARTIQGYACQFGLESRGDYGRERVGFGAIQGVAPAFLLLNHDGYRNGGRSLARTQDGTLQLWVDSLGLRFEATLPTDDDRAVHVYWSIVAGAAAGVSMGWQGGESRMVDGVREHTAIRPWELSILLAPHKPRFAGTSVGVVRSARDVKR